MGLFGKREEQPEIRIPTAQELLSQSAAFQQQQFPQFAQARETGLGALMGQGFAPQVNIPGVDWGAFGPSTFEQGLATSAFAPLMEQAQRQALQIGSLAGIPSAAPAHFGRAMAPAIQNIGQFLAGQQQQRGLTEQQRLMQEVLSSEQARQFQLSQAIGQDPFRDIFAGAQLGQQQTAALAAEEMRRWQEEQAERQGMIKSIGSLFGFVPGTATGLAMGEPLGSTLGSSISGSLDVFKAMMPQLPMPQLPMPQSQIGATVPVGGL